MIRTSKRTTARTGRRSTATGARIISSPGSRRRRTGAGGTDSNRGRFPRSSFSRVRACPVFYTRPNGEVGRIMMRHYNETESQRHRAVRHWAGFKPVPAGYNRPLRIHRIWRGWRIAWNSAICNSGLRMIRYRVIFVQEAGSGQVQRVPSALPVCVCRFFKQSAQLFRDSSR